MGAAETPRRHQQWGNETPRVLDMFASGGAIPLEALRLGCETLALELNPVAYLILLCTLVYPQKYGQPVKREVQHGALEVEEEVNPLAKDVRWWGEWVLEEARKEIGLFTFRLRSVQARTPAAIQSWPICGRAATSLTYTDSQYRPLPSVNGPARSCGHRGQDGRTLQAGVGIEAMSSFSC
jgi:hypothetical protein